MRIAFLTISFYGFIILAMYQSIISARLTISISKAPINSMEELLNSPYKLTLLEDSKYRMIMSAKNDSVYGKIRDSGRMETLGTYSWETETNWIKSAIKGK